MSVFRSAVRREFAFLVQEFGYRLVDDSPVSLKYERKGTLVVVLHDRERSGELTLALRPEGQSPPLFTFGEMLRSSGALPNVPSAYEVCDDNLLPQFVGELARNLQKYCVELLSGSSHALQRLDELRKRESEAFGRERALRYAREDANRAWVAGDYEKVVQFLSPHSEFLSGSEKQKLKIALARGGGTA